MRPVFHSLMALQREGSTPGVNLSRLRAIPTMPLNAYPRILSDLRKGQPCAIGVTDEVARNGALQEELRPEVFLGAPLHLLHVE